MLINKKQCNICASCSSYLHRRQAENSISLALNISSRKPSFLKNQHRNSENTKLSTLGNAIFRSNSKAVSGFLLPPSWVEYQQNSSIKLPPLCSLLLRFLVSFKQESGRMADKRTAALGAKVKSNLTLGKCPSDSPVLINTEWTALLSAHSRFTSALLKPLHLHGPGRWKCSRWLRAQG